MNIQHRLIKDRLSSEVYINSGDITVALNDELIGIIDNDVLDVTIEGLDYMEIEDDEITFNFIASFNDKSTDWQHQKSMFVWISYHKDTNFEESYSDRDWN